MATATKKPKEYGILAAIDWNSRKWQAPPTQDDLDHSLFGFVVENGVTYTSLNFAHESNGLGKEEYYYGLVPHFHTNAPVESRFKNVQIVFLRSRDWVSGHMYIVGFYAFPEVVRKKKTSLTNETKTALEPNIRALVKNVHLLSNFIDLSNYPDISSLLPEDRQLGRRGYNYLTKANVNRILDAMRKSNPDDLRLQGIMLRLIPELEKA